MSELVKKVGCGGLDLSHARTQHCFPGDASHHFVCCTGISNPKNDKSPHGNKNPLLKVIMAANTDPNNLSWCTCSEEICEKQLGGTVSWNMHGAGWKGYKPKNIGFDPKNIL